jgi:LPXTG-motif cell wall-anchored protein
VFQMSAQVGEDSSTLISATYIANNIGAAVEPPSSAQAAPSFSPAAGMVAQGSGVTLTSDGADHIYYTTDGTNPTAAVGGSTLEYTAPITINAGMTIKAIATKAGISNSAIADASYSVMEIEPIDGNVSGDGIGSAILPAQDADGSGRVVVELSAEPVSGGGSYGNISIAAQSLSGAGDQIVTSYDVSLIESLYDASNNLTRSGRVPAERITGPITIRLPLPAQFAGATGLVVVYIDDEGVVTYLPTTIVTIDGVKYLEFTTTHFSVYAIACNNVNVNVTSSPNTVIPPAIVKIPNTGSASTIYALLGLLAIAASACIMLYIRRKHASSK